MPFKVGMCTEHGVGDGRGEKTEAPYGLASTYREKMSPAVGDMAAVVSRFGRSRMETGEVMLPQMEKGFFVEVCAMRELGFSWESDAGFSAVFATETVRRTKMRC